MERKRTRLRLSSSSDDEREEGDGDRRLRLRSRKQARYAEEDDDEVEVVEEEEGEEDNEQPGASAQSNHTQKGLLKVTCGNKTGLLDKDKLYQAVKCIKCGDGWFSPSAFEELGGKGANKKWKTSIVHDKKPLKFWIEQGVLTTQGFKKRGTETTKKMKIRSSTRTESSSAESEIQSAEESEEDDVKDEDWCPGSEGLVLETEEERVELGDNGQVVDSAVDESKEEEDEVERGEMEDEDMPAAEGNGSGDVEGREAKSIISAPLREVKVVIRRLPEFQVHTNGLMEYPLKDSDDAQNEDERACSGSPADGLSVTASPAQLDHSHMSDASTVVVDEKESQEDFMEDSEREEDEQRKIKTESSPTLSAPANTSQDIKPETKHTGEHAAGLCASPVLVVTVTDSHLVDIKGGWEEAHCREMEEEGEQTEMVPALFEESDLDMSRDAASPQTFIKEEISATMDYKPPTTPLSLFVECKCETTEAATSGRDAAEIQVMLLETGVPQISRASDTTPSPDVVEAQSSGRSATSCDLDTMDLDQLRREKMKMQIRVLRLQKEYYTQKLKEQRK